MKPIFFLFFFSKKEGEDKKKPYKILDKFRDGRHSSLQGHGCAHTESEGVNFIPDTGVLNITRAARYARDVRARAFRLSGSTWGVCTWCGVRGFLGLTTTNFGADEN